MKQVIMKDMNKMEENVIGDIKEEIKDLKREKKNG